MSGFARTAAQKTASKETPSQAALWILLVGGVLAGPLCAGAAAAQNTPKAQDSPTKAPPLDLSSSDTGWISMGGEWIAKPGTPPPVGFDPAHPYVPNNIGKQPTFRIAELNNPNLTQFAKDGLKKSNDEVLRGKDMYSREARWRNVKNPLLETACAENNEDYFHQNLVPIPQADQPDF
jgi:hypothetical protein